MRGQCIFAIGFESNIEPVCVNFSPSSDNLIVGMAHSSCTNGRLPFSTFSQMFTSSQEPGNLPQAFVYKLSKTSRVDVEQPRKIKELRRFDAQHLWGSVTIRDLPSLNTIAWYPFGIIFGTTKGQLVMMQPY